MISVTVHVGRLYMNLKFEFPPDGLDPGDTLIFCALSVRNEARNIQDGF